MTDPSTMFAALAAALTFSAVLALAETYGRRFTKKVGRPHGSRCAGSRKCQSDPNHFVRSERRRRLGGDIRIDILADSPGTSALIRFWQPSTQSD
jgi:hypothetical protein